MNARKKENSRFFCVTPILRWIRNELILFRKKKEHNLIMSEFKLAFENVHMIYFTLYVEDWIDG